MNRGYTFFFFIKKKTKPHLRGERSGSIEGIGAVVVQRKSERRRAMAMIAKRREEIQAKGERWMSGGPERLSVEIQVAD